MALSNEQLAAPVKGKDKGKSASSGPIVDTSITFDRNIFLTAEGAGKVNRKGEKVDGDNDRVKFSSELRKEYTSYLNNYMRRLGETKRDYPRLFEKGREFELKLLEQLTENNEPSKDKINNFLLTPEAWMITTQIMERQMAHKLFALGLTAAINPDAQRENLIDGTKVVTRIDEGVLRGLMRDKVAPHYGKIGKIAAMGGAAGIGALGFAAVLGLNSSPEGAAAGAAALAIAAGIRSLSKGGLTIDVQQSADALKYLKSDPDEAEFLLAMNKLDVNNFDVVRSGSKDVIRLAPGVQTNLNTRQTWEDVMSTMYARQSFYEALGLPARDIDALPEQFLFNFDKSKGQMEQTGAAWEARLRKHYDANRDILDRGVARIPAIGGARAVRAIPPRPANHPDFDSKNLDVEGNLKRLDKARREVMLDMVQEHIAKVVSREAASDSDIKTLTARADAIKGGGAEHKKKIDKIDKEIAALESEKSIHGPLQEKVKAYETARATLQEAYYQYSSEFAYARGTDINVLEKQLYDSLNDLSSPGSVASRINAQKTVRNAAIATAHSAVDAEVALLTRPPTGDQLKERYQTRLDIETASADSALKKLTEEAAGIEEKLKKIKEIREAIDKAEIAARRAAGEALLDTRETIRGISLDYTELAGWGISAIDLQQKTQDELMAQINGLHPLGGPGPGWDAADNAIPANVLKLQHAIAEAKAQARENFDPSQLLDRQIYAQITEGKTPTGTPIITPPITAEELISSNNDDLMTSLEANYAWDPATPEENMKRLQAARSEARRKLLLRIGTMSSDQVLAIDVEIKNKTESKDALKFDKEAKAMELTKDALGRRGEIYAEVFKDLTKLTDITALSATSEGVTPAEVALALPAGYYKIAEMIFNYQGTGENRQKSFEAVAFIMPPDRLAAWLNEGLELKLTGVFDLAAVLTTIQSLATRNQMPSHRLYAGIVDVMGKVRNQAMAITI